VRHAIETVPLQDLQTFNETYATMDITTLQKYLEDKHTFRCGWGTSCVDTSFETMPSEFIGFAELDLQSTFDHKYINALSNAKRALDCQADRLLKLFGYYKDSQDKFWGFPKKIELIQKFQIIAPRVLNKINKTRNLMEHQYIKPKATQVEDFLDIVSLFIASTDHYASNFIEEVTYINEDNEEFKNLSEIEITIDSKNAIILVETNQFKPKKKIKFEIKKSDIEYIDTLKRHLKKIEFR
jgi:hypothetical protein